MIKKLIDKFSLDTLNRKQRIILSITGIVIVSLMLLGITYGYFLTTVSGNTNSNSISISTAKLELVYGDGNGTIVANNLEPGVTIEKTFTVTNNGTGTIVGYGVFLESVINTFERTSDLKLKVTCDSNIYGEGYCNGYDGDSPSHNEYLLQNSIEQNEIHTYTLSLTYIEAGVDQSVDMNKQYEAKVQIYSTGETVDFEGKITNYSEGDYVIVRSDPKKSQIRSDGSFKVIGLLPGNHTIEVYAKDSNTPKYSKTFTIIKGEGTTTSNTAYVTDISRTITSILNLTSEIFRITGVSESLPLSAESLGGKILANGATYVSSWTEGKSYYHGHECGDDLVCLGNHPTSGDNPTGSIFSEFTLYNLNGTKNEKLIKTNESYGESIENGLFMDEDDYGITYYYKGSIVNNYVKFAGLDWRIVRINGDGSVRLILADTTKNLGVGEDSKFNISYDDDAYVGYMYGSANSDNYNDTHKNINDSTIKTKVDLFYETYLKDDYSTYLSDTLFCANKVPNIINYLNGYGFMDRTKEYYHGTNYGGNISFKCSEDATNTFSRYTANSTSTNKKILVNNDLKYPIGLLSYEEYSLSGGQLNIKDNRHYLITGMNVNSYLSSGNDTEIMSNGIVNAYWLMSPESRASSCSSTNYDGRYYNLECLSTENYTTVKNVIIGFSSHIQYSNDITYTSGVRPVINIKPGIKVTSGDGTEANPYVI